MDKAVELAVRMTADASDVDAAFDAVGSSARAMADDVDAAARQVDGAAGGLDGAAESADHLGSKSAQAAGGLGDLGGALSMLPGPLGGLGAGMEAAAGPIMGVTGAMDLANLALESNVVQSVRSKGAMIAHAVATKAIGAATKTYAAMQWLLNAALTANPIGLVIIAVVALVAVIVLAYKKSETFRTIVQGVMKAVKFYFFGVVIVAKELVEWIADKAPAAWDKLKDAAVSAAKWMGDKIGDYFDLVTKPIQTVIDLVDKLLDKISSIDFPDMPDLTPGFDLPGPLGRVAVGGASSSSSSGTPGTYIDARTYVTVDGSGIVDEAAVARTLEPVLARHATRLGQIVGGEAAPAW